VRWFVAISTVFALVALAFGMWASTPAQGDRSASIDVWTNPNVSVTSTPHSVILTPTETDSASRSQGLVFIPGARVDAYAYMFVLSGIVEREGVTVVITKPTFNLAFFDTRPLSEFTADAPQVTDWFVGGHSLGGVRSCMLAEDGAVTPVDTTDVEVSDVGVSDVEVAGLVLFASYCANDVSATQLPVLSIAGSNDLLSTPQKIRDAAPLLPRDTTFVDIEGGNHAQFGTYGKQSGDGDAAITGKAQRAEITRALAQFFRTQANT
jgi:pimeloyl-ACP methyl ester carboxylesterase